MFSKQDVERYRRYYAFSEGSRWLGLATIILIAAWRMTDLYVPLPHAWWILPLLFAPALAGIAGSILVSQIKPDEEMEVFVGAWRELFNKPAKSIPFTDDEKAAHFAQARRILMEKAYAVNWTRARQREALSLYNIANGAYWNGSGTLDVANAAKDNAVEADRRAWYAEKEYRRTLNYLTKEPIKGVNILTGPEFEDPEAFLVLASHHV